MKISELWNSLENIENKALELAGITDAVCTAVSNGLPTETAVYAISGISSSIGLIIGDISVLINETIKLGKEE
ncbi:MAG: hypothetical protein HFH67_06015 [Lachnospiraceae bacterium]|nr:hypothetical protein [Lachnospiraceae bacterium]